MYMLAKYVLCRDYKMGPDVLGDVPPKYVSYHDKKIRETREDFKWICYDEFHRTSSAKAVRDQVIIDMRESRKWGTGIFLASQSEKDFSEDIVDLASGVLIPNRGNNANVTALQEKFGFNDTARELLASECNGPGPAAPFLAILDTKAGLTTQRLANTISPIESWAFSTMVQDVTIREAVTRAIGAFEARKLLGAQFPGGSAAHVVEAVLSQMADSYQTDGERMTGAAIKVAQQILDRVNPHLRRAA